MNIEHIAPAEIERESMKRIEAELGPTPWLGERERAVLKRVVHATADLEYKDNLIFSKNALDSGLSALDAGATIVTDTNMALSGISKPALAALGCEAQCFMADSDVAAMAKDFGTTRAVAAVDIAAERLRGKRLIFAIGNAPTALLRLSGLIEEGKLAPSLVIGAPVGFVNVIQSKLRLVELETPHIAAMGRKGGSAVAAAICNALLYMLRDGKCGNA